MKEKKKIIYIEIEESELIEIITDKVKVCVSEKIEKEK